ncbi:MAG: hypothetical protein KDC92_09855 [Bacteroidetes bacterium]|nr:hypothetical protein [Bacteroidota bacterium]
MNQNDIKLYLPKFLSAKAEEELLSCLKDFPENVNQRLYSDILLNEPTIFQGDVISEMIVVNLPSTQTKNVDALILSNTCDIDRNNERYFPSRIIYSPLIAISKYSELLRRKGITNEKITNHLNTIRKQRITQIFYLPEKQSKYEESIVFLDRLNNIGINSIDPSHLMQRRKSILSNYGAYLFVLKMSIHFSRIRDKVER